MEGSQGLEPLWLWLNEDGIPRDAHGWHHTFDAANARIADLGLEHFTFTAHMHRHFFALKWFSVSKLIFAHRLGHLSEEEMHDFREQFGDHWHLVQTMLGHRRVETTKEVYLEPFRNLQVELLLAHADGFPVERFMADAFAGHPRVRTDPLAVAPRGRRASLPGRQSSTARELVDDLVVRCFAEDGSASRDFRFDALPVAEGLRQGLAMAFRRRTAPGAGLRSLDSMLSVYRAAVGFARYLSTLAWPPTELAHLVPEHLDAYFGSRKDKAVRAGDELADLKRLLKHAEGLSEAVTAKLGESNPRRPRTESPKESYSVQELRRIVDAARLDLRAATARIRANREVLRRFRHGEELGGDRRRLELLDFVDRFGDVPRWPCTRGQRAGQDVAHRWVFHYGAIDDIVCQLHLSGMEVTAGLVLLTAMTGQNKNVLLKTPAVHHRADGYTGATPTAIVETHKPRRGRRAHMSLALSDLPDWISIPSDPEDVSARDELHTPFGLYVLLHESGFPDEYAFEDLLYRLEILADDVQTLEDGEHVSGPAADAYRHRVTAATRQFAGDVLTSDRQARDLLGNPLLQIHHGQGMTCVLDPAQALCRLRGTIDDPLVTPDTDDCRPKCRNIARTDRDIQHLRRHHRELTAVVDNPLAPPIRHDRERHELTRLQRILDAHEPEKHQ